MQTIAGHEVLERLHEGRSHAVLRARRGPGDATVILKMLRSRVPTQAAVAGLRGEFSLLRELDAVGAIKANELISDDNLWVLSLEDFGGSSLARLALAGAIPLRELIALALALVDAVDSVHAAGVAHLGISAGNIVWNRETGALKLIDFAAAAPRGPRRPRISDAVLPAGSLGYIAPEQTGRINRVIDFRSDYYAIGVVLYELLTGRRPFVAESPVELVHCHIAVEPTPPRELDARVPESLSRVVLKLLAKRAEDRYQSAHGLRRDLERIAGWIERGEDDASFTPGAEDTRESFQLAQGLYGQARALGKLGDALARVREAGVATVFVRGQTGAGKSALLGELGRLAADAGARCVVGRFDPITARLEPHGALLQALRGLVRQLLGEDDRGVARWRARILVALSSNASLLAESLPELRALLGPQPAIQALTGGAARHRFRLALRGFVEALATRDEPLVLALDDVQWADDDSLMLIEDLACFAEVDGLLLVVSCLDGHFDGGLDGGLDEELGRDAVDRLRARLLELGAPHRTIQLDPIGPADITRLVADTLLCARARAAPLARVVHDKTAGNPMFVREFLSELHAAGALRYERSARAWTWSIDQIERSDVTANVVELLARRLDELPRALREVLTTAACLGRSFDAARLAAVGEHDTATCRAALTRAAAEGFIVDLGDDSYRFTHERAQQLVYTRIAEARRAETHRRAAERLLEGLSEDAAKDSPELFTIVRHLNAGRTGDALPPRPKRAARLNLAAGRRARRAAAYAPAHEFFEVAASLCARAPWDQLRLEAYLDAADTAYLTGDHARAEALIQDVLVNARSTLERARALELRVQSHTARDDLDGALRAALAGLREFDVHISEHPGRLDILRELASLRARLLGRRVSALRSLPRMRDARAQAIARLILVALPPAFRANQELYVLLALRVVILSLRYGQSPASPMAFVTCAHLMCSVLGDVETGMEFAALSRELNSSIGAPEFRAMTPFAIGALINHWREHAKRDLDFLRDAKRVALETGAIEYAAYCMSSESGYAMVLGEDLEEVALRATENAAELRQTGNPILTMLGEFHLDAITDLRDPDARLLTLLGGDSTVDARRDQISRSGDVTVISTVGVIRMMLALYFERFELGRAVSEALAPALESLSGFIYLPVYRFADALSLLAGARDVHGRARARVLKRARAGRRAIARWARLAPMNFENKVALIDAELARVEGRHGDAREHYDHAIRLATRHGWTHEAGLACELAARYYLGRDMGSLGGHYLRRARHSYIRWGARAKVSELERRYAAHLQLHDAVFEERADPSARERTETGSQLASSLDFHSVLKASQAIADKIVLDELLRTLMRTVLENAGASRGALALERAGQWLVEAHGAPSAESMRVLEGAPVSAAHLPMSAFNLVVRTREPLVVTHATREEPFARDPYVVTHQPQSLLCVPLLHQRALLGVLYLENDLIPSAFTHERLTVVNLLSTQIVISIRNSARYGDLEQAVAERTAELRETNDSLSASNRELDAFAHTVAHDLKIPLGTLIGYAELIAEEPELDAEELRELVDKLRRTSHDMATIVDELLLLASVRRGQVTPRAVAMAEVVDRSLDRLSGMLARHGLTPADIERPTRWEPVLGYAPWIEEVLVNYLSNALKYGGRPPRVELGQLREPDGALRCFVRDNGPGVDPAIQDRLFSEFAQLENARVDGHGLGLSIVQRIITRLDGRVGVETAPGEGSSFYFCLPAPPDEARSVDAADDETSDEAADEAADETETAAPTS